MKLFTFIAAYIPYEQGERYALGERIYVPFFYALGCLATVILMVLYIRKTKKDKRRRKRKPDV